MLIPVKINKCIFALICIMSISINGCSADYEPAEDIKGSTETSAEWISARDEKGSLSDSGEVCGFKYEILMKEYYESSHKTRGYHMDTLNEPNAPYYYWIFMGERSTGGYSISVYDILSDGAGNVIIKVEETSPGPMDHVTEAFTYPSCSVSLYPCPVSVSIMDLDGNEFKQIDIHGENDMKAEVISAKEAKRIMDEGTDCIILDVREADEYAEGHIDGAVQLSYLEIGKKAEEMLTDKDKLILVYCRSGRRSAIAASELTRYDLIAVYKENIFPSLFRCDRRGKR